MKRKLNFKKPLLITVVAFFLLILIFGQKVMGKLFPFLFSYQKRIKFVCQWKGLSEDQCKMVLGQSWHETGGFVSNVFKANNNCFGMKVPRVRKTPYILGAGTNAPVSEGSTPYAKYSSIENSVLDLFNLLEYNKIDWSKINTVDQYSSFLKSKGYYGDSYSNYTAGVVRGIEATKTV